VASGESHARSEGGGSIEGVSTNPSLPTARGTGLSVSEFNNAVCIKLQE